MMRPDYQRAAEKALETLVTYGITGTPVLSLPIMKKIPNVLPVSFAELGDMVGISRLEALYTFGGKNSQDAVTLVEKHDEGLRYVVAYNKMLPMYLIQRAMARELGHIILEHDGSLPEDVRMEETACFAYHLLCPRPLIHMVVSSGIRITVSVLNNLTGCDDNCLVGMRKLPVIETSPDLNRKVRQQFFDYVLNFFEYQRIASHYDKSSEADFGNYMTGYKE